MKRAPMKWIDRLAITSYGGLTIVSALRTEWFIAYLAASLAVTVWLMSLHEREAAYLKRRADMLGRRYGFEARAWVEGVRAQLGGSACSTPT